MAAAPSIRLTVPGTLAYRSVAVRVVAEACRLVSAPGCEDMKAGAGYDLSHPFDAAFVSAFAEIFNNIAIHAYERRGGGDVELAITVAAGPDASLTVEAKDSGKSFELAGVEGPDLDALPEGGMGIHIARAMLDEVSYQAGPPNQWRLVKRLSNQR